MPRPAKATMNRPEPTDMAQLAPSPSPTEAPHIIRATGVYMLEDLRRFFGLKPSSVRREVRLGRLRIAKRCGRYYCLGQWVQQWIESGELKRQQGRPETDADRIEHDDYSSA